MSDDFTEKNILVVDNSPLMTRMIKSYLVKAGFDAENISTATDGQQAYSLAELQAFHLITSGMHMRALGGLELLKKLRESEEERLKKTPLVLITSERKANMTRDLEQAGGNGYLSKPFTTDALIDTVKNVFNHEKESFVEPKPIFSDVVDVLKNNVSSPKIVSAFVASTLEALSQYMVTAEVENLINGDGLRGDFISWIDLTDTEMNSKLIILMVFPKSVVIDLYENLFGEVDMDSVSGIVEELVNIIAGIVKSKLIGHGADIYRLVHPDSEYQLSDEATVDLQMGLPISKKGDNIFSDVLEPGASNFTVPFNIKEEKVYLQVSFQEP
jgi:two-component system chemotaxis response regulator CheY